MRIIIDLPEDILQQIEQLAASENRSRKNYIETLLTDHIKGKKTSKKPPVSPSTKSSTNE